MHAAPTPSTAGEPRHPATASADPSAPMWRPSAERIAAARITAYQGWLQQHQGLQFGRYEDLWQWSVDQPEAFWSSIWQHFQVPARRPFDRILGERRMPHARWFEGAELNLVDAVFAQAQADSPALIWDSEAAGRGEMAWAEVRRQVAALAATFRRLGVRRGDRVAGYLPNIPAATVAFLATASLGAVWSICAPDMGPVSVGDRFRQIEPTLLVACDGYRFAGKPFDRRPVLDEVLGQLPSVQAVVWVPHLGPTEPPPEPPSQVQARRWLWWAEAVAAPDAVLACEPLPSDHPLWILYSSGTTGLPKPIVHGHGGVLLNGLVNMVLMGDVWPGDRVFWLSSTSWMVWNAHHLALLGGATLFLFDGAVTGTGPEPDWGLPWRLAGRERITAFGAGAAFHLGGLKAGIRPGELADLSALRSVGSTGSPLSPEGYRWLYGAVKPDLWLNCCSGGTDIAAGFLVGLPTLPVYVGEMQCRPLGTRTLAYDEGGQPVVGAVGELVCPDPIPSMPLCFWNDPGDARYLDSYFDVFTGPDGAPVWRHGDWMQLVPRPDATGGIVYGRSDATINRQGIRMGTAELYRAVEGFDAVLDSLVVDLEYLGRPSWMGLFVVLRPGLQLDDALTGALRAAIRSALSARHVPDAILQVPAVPRTLTGKKLELPVKKLMLGHPVARVVNRDAMGNPEAIDWFIDFAARRAAAEPPPAA